MCPAHQKKCFWSSTKTLLIISVIIVHSKSNNHADNPVYWSCVLRCSSKIIHCDHWNEIWFTGILLWLLFKIFCLGFIYTVSQRKLTFIIRLFNTPVGCKLMLVHIWTLSYCNCFVSVVYNDEGVVWSLGKGSWWWIWLEASSWRCIQTSITPSVIHQSDWHRISLVHCCPLCYLIHHHGRPIHCVSIFILLVHFCSR